MAKGDHKRVSNEIDAQGELNQNRIDNARTDTMRMGQGLENRFNVAADRNIADYGDLMGGYRSLIGNPASNQNFGAYGGYQDFSKTGGYSGQDIQDLRERAISPLRGVYDRAESELERNRSLQGGYSPNFAAASAKMARNLGQQVADTNVNVNASIADAIRQGKLAGLGGMTTIDSAKMQEALANRSADLSAMSGASSLYSATPGMSSMFGNQMLESNRQRIGVEQLQANLADMMIRARLGMSQVPGDYQQALGNIGGTLALGGQVAGMFNPMSSVLPSRSIAPSYSMMPSGGGGISY